MNIFVLDNDPLRAAMYHNDRHVCKMILESAQILATVHSLCDSVIDGVPLRPTHVHHPCVKWAAEGHDNYLWLKFLFVGLLGEYTTRYCKTHSYAAFASKFIRVPDKLVGLSTPHVQCIPDKYKVEADPVLAYRRYYFYEKRHLAHWRYPRSMPDWYRLDVLSSDMGVV